MNLSYYELHDKLGKVNSGFIQHIQGILAEEYEIKFFYLGRRGETGEKGDEPEARSPGKGFKGAQGEPGLPGRRGSDGVDGIPGEKGEKGDPGRISNSIATKCIILL